MGKTINSNMGTQKDVLIDIRERVIRIEEHMNAINGRVNKHETKIEDIEPRLRNLNQWEKIKSIVLMGCSAIIGSMGTYIFLK